MAYKPTAAGRSDQSRTAFEPGDTVEVGVGTSITDPFGKSVPSQTLKGRVE